jgi:transcriptional regulator with XRE-family HTH domain
MSISMSNFEPAAKNEVPVGHVADAVVEARLAIGYTLEQVAVTTGLTVDELAAIESGEGTDPAQLQRIASAFGLPASTFLVA